jgi:hypothetical protein
MTAYIQKNITISFRPVTNKLEVEDRTRVEKKTPTDSSVFTPYVIYHDRCHNYGYDVYETCC